jgi:hypothetical protein
LRWRIPPYPPGVAAGRQDKPGDGALGMIQKRPAAAPLKLWISFEIR